MKNYIPLILLLAIVPSVYSQTITSLSRITSPTLPITPNLIANGDFETGAPPLNTWYQWAKTRCNPIPGN